MTTPVFESAPVWQNYIDLANDAKRWLQLPASDTTRDADLQDVVDAACTWVQVQIGQPVAPTSFFRRFNGYSGFGGSMIPLPYYPVIGAPTVVEWWGNSGPHALTLQTPESQGGGDMYTLDSLRGIVTRSYLGLLQRPFFPGLKNVEITWTAGRNPVPPDIRLATREYVKYWWANTQEASRGPSLRPAYGDVGSNEGRYDDWPGVEAKVKALLRPYMQVGVA